MTEWEMLSRYNYFKLPLEDRRAFDRWQKSAAVTASLFALALLAIAVNAWFSPDPAPTAVAANQHATDGMAPRALVTPVSEDMPTQVIEDPL